MLVDSISSAVISATTLIAVTLIGWLSQRATRESRLLLKIERFGKAFAGMPESTEKDAFKGHYLKKVRELNAEFEQKPSRVLINIVTVGMSILGVIAVILIAPAIAETNIEWLSALLGLVLGLLVGFVNLAATWLIYRRSSAQAFRQRSQRFIDGTD